MFATQLLVKSNKAAARGKKGASVTSELREEPQHFMDRPVQSAWGFNSPF